MKRNLIILLFALPLFLSGQTAGNATDKKLKKDRIGVFATGVASYLNGVDGRERNKEVGDYVKNLSSAGFKAEGGVLPRYGFSAGIYYSRFFSKRYAIHTDLGYLQTGFREKIFVEGADSSMSLKRDYNLTLKMDYIHLFSGVRYYHDSGLSLMLGVYMNYNILDKIDYHETVEFKSRAGDVKTDSSHVGFFHEHYKENRQIFLMGLGFGVGYKFQRWEVDATIKNSSSIPYDDEVYDMKFVILQVGVRYRFNKINNE